MSGWGRWVPLGKRRPRLPARPQPIVGGDLDDVGPAVVGVGRGATSHRPSRSTFITAQRTGPAPPRPSGHDVGDRDERLSRRPRPATRRPGTQTGGRRSRVAHRGGVHTSPPHKRTGRLAASCSTASARSRRDDHQRVVGRGGRLAPVLDRAGSSWPSVGAPRRRRRRRGTPLRPHRRGPASRVAATGATSATCRARSTSCFIVRTKSPPVSSSAVTTDLGQALARPPTRGRRRRTRDRAAGARRQAARPLVGGEVLADRADPPPSLASGRRREPRRRPADPGCGARRRTPTAARRASPRRAPSNTPRRTHSATSRSHSWNIRGEHSPDVVNAQPGPSPPSRRSPRRSSTSSDVVELPPERLPDDRRRGALRSAELALEPLDLAGRPHPLAQVGVGLDGVRPVAATPVPRSPRSPARPQRRPAQGARATSGGTRPGSG